MLQMLNVSNDFNRIFEPEKSEFLIKIFIL